MDLAGRHILITGANSGIGLVTAKVLAARGARLLLAGRSAAKTQPVIDAIRAQHAGAKVDFLPLDLGDFASIRACAAQVNALDEPLHVLLNNAGLAGARGLTANGFEAAFGTNHLGPFLFTQLLLDKLKQSAPARVVIVASRANKRVRGIDFASLRSPTKTVTGVAEYEVSKLCNVIHARELGRRLQGTGVTTYALCPGVIATDIWRKVPWPARVVMKAFMKTPEEGAQTSIFLASSPDVAAQTGRYYTSCKERPANPLADDAALTAELWSKSEAWVAA